MYTYNVNQEGNTQSNQYKHSSDFYKDIQREQFHVNSLGDVDHRQLGNASHSQDAYHAINPWANPPHDQRQFYEDRSCQKYYRHHESERQASDGNRIPSLDYTGHRPPSSDYYGSTSGTTINNNNTSFSRSVDDTVDIVRKRLMNRNEPQQLAQDTSVNENNSEQAVRESTSQSTQQEQPTKKRIQRQRQVKSNCDKMKSNIVHQLFKMDKDKMHKLMDDPGSSSKFEYAISSLITESQNSLNRHLRSVAEKSLVSTSSDFIHNDNNTIYEDTFMKQMQCLLDPQDTVLLEDIKPLVMAELSKVLQLDDFEHRYDQDDQNLHLSKEDQVNYHHYENFNYDEFPQDRYYDVDQRPPSSYQDPTTFAHIEVTESSNQNYDYSSQRVKIEEDYQHPGSLFERRTSMKTDQSLDNQSVDRQRSVDQQQNVDRRQSLDSQRQDSQRQRRSIDKSLEENFGVSEEALPLFDTNAEQLSEEEEDTFAELDRQYHVPVDDNFLQDVSARTTPNHTQLPEVNPINVKKEIDTQLQSFIQSPFELFPSSCRTDRDDRQTNVVEDIKQEVLQSPDFPKENSTPANAVNIAIKMDHIHIKEEHAAKNKEKERETETSNISKASQSNSRKRSIDQRPSHRKEKRKKSESSSSEVIKTPVQKHDAVSSNIAHSKTIEKSADPPKAYYSIFTSKDESKEVSKDNKRSDTTEKDYSDKYVKRKESARSKDRDSHKKRSSSSSSQTILSPKDSNNSSVKGDSKTKLKPIDMFVEQPKKVSVHQAHRNTAPIPTIPTTPKAAEDSKTKQVTTPTRKPVQTKHASTQVIKRVITKETQTVKPETKYLAKHCQTEKLKSLSKASQTPRTFMEKPKSKSKDAFERMKEIDMEIQVLLQEKFKLYNNLEAKDSCPSNVNLGMTVLNVTADDDDNENDGEEVDSGANMDSTMIGESTLSADAIADDFTSIPVEELEQIALESVEDVNFEESKVEKRNARHKALQQERMNSASPQSSTSSRRSSKKAKTPNISLLEQIITDDRPLEDIISLDDLEEPSPRHKKKSRTKPKKKVSKKSKPVRSIDVDAYDLKECSVILIQTDLSKFMKPPSPEVGDVIEIDSINTPELLEESPELLKDCSEPVKDCLEPLNECPVPEPLNSEHQKTSEPVEVIEETVVNDIQFDMLDVSEDIVIGESCEIKDKDLSEQSVAVSEDLILDNSQSSADDAFAAETGQPENECKTYDFSTDEDLRRDSLTVTGNADAVLAVEVSILCIN